VRHSTILAALALCIAPARAAVDRIVIIKVDGLPQRLIDQYALDPQNGNPRLPHIAEVFGKNGAALLNFYTRGISLSAPSWSLLDTGRHLEIRGNVEYDRYTLRVWDYLNFFPFYVDYALSRRVDMPGSEFLDQQGIPLLIDRFPYEQRYQSFQLLQRGIRWSTLESSLTRQFGRPVRDLFDEWQTGFSMGDSVNRATENDVLRALMDPKIRYIDYFTGEYDHVAHLTPDRVSQLHVLDSLDALVGRIWAGIEASPLASTTLLVLVSDHGMNTSGNVFSQGYNLVDWFNSAAGGGHHVITDRHPLTEFKIRGLDPFVSAVITPSRNATYLSGKSADYPTVILDLDGNERVNIGLRENSLNQVQILLDQVIQRKLPGAVRAAAMDALFEILNRQRPLWRARLDEIRRNLGVLHTRIAETEKTLEGKPKKWTKTERDLGLDKDARRLADHIQRWTGEDRADMEYLETMERLLSLTPGDFDPGKFKIEELIPRKSLGGLNSIRDLQNYVVGLQPGGLVLDGDGMIDFQRSFHTIDYFSALRGISVRNNVQKEVSAQPVDFLAVAVPAAPLRAALNDVSVRGGVWLYRDEERQALILTRDDPSQGRQLRYIPVSGLTQDGTGALHFRACELANGFPLELFEDPAVAISNEERAHWISEWHTEREWMNAVHKSRYSNGIIGLTEELLAPEPPGDFAAQHRRERLRTDLLVFASDHWNFNVRGFNPGGNHGSLLRVSTHSVLMMAGGDRTGIPKGVRVETPYDSLSFVPTLLSLVGRPEPNLPGPVIEELVPAASEAAHQLTVH
jgi:hypothetical protein